MFKRFFWQIALLFLPLVTLAKLPDLMLLQEYKNQDISGWVMSEKLDGVRAYWDGKQLISRQGNPFTPPDYFLKKVSLKTFLVQFVPQNPKAGIS